MRGGAPRGELFARLYAGAFAIGLFIASPLVSHTPAAHAKTKPVVALGPASTTVPTTATTAAPPQPVTTAPAPALPPAFDIEHHLPFEAAPDGRRAVVLTFDDGPHAFFTPRVLDVLRDRGVKAVFCVVGQQIATYPQLVARIAAEGHALCDHTENHDTHMSQKDPAYVSAMIQHPADMIRDITGRPPTFYRGPGGDLSTYIIERAHQLGMRVIGWSVDPQDYFKPGGSVIQDRIMSRVRPGSVVLMHDGGGDRLQTLEQLAGLIDRLRAAGYSFVLP
jgi:peptidoglycan/xylan/chitin deacetylase (PgdA/CDA1 family)